MARIADADRPEIQWDAIGEAVDRPATVNRATVKRTVEDIPAQLRAIVEAAFRDKVTKVIPVDTTRLGDRADAQATELVRLARLYGTLREPQLSIGATVVPDCKIPGRAEPFPLAVTIGARDKISRPRKTDLHAAVNGGNPAAPVETAAPVATPSAAPIETSPLASVPTGQQVNRSVRASKR